MILLGGGCFPAAVFVSCTTIKLLLMVLVLYSRVQVEASSKYTCAADASTYCCSVFGSYGFNVGAGCCTGGVTEGVCDSGCSNAKTNGPYTFNGTQTAYCNVEIEGGGWHLAYTVNPSDGHRMGWGGAYWTQASDSHTVSESNLGRDFVSAVGAGMPANDILIVNGYRSDGTYDAYTVWPFREKRKSLFHYVRGGAAVVFNRASGVLVRDASGTTELGTNEEIYS